MYLFPPQTPEEILLERERNELVLAELLKLPAREERVIRLRFGLDGSEPLRLRECATQLNCSGENARRLEAKALNRLRRSLRRKIWTPYRVDYTPRIANPLYYDDLKNPNEIDEPFDATEFLRQIAPLNGDGWPVPSRRGRAVDTDEYVYIFADDLQDLTDDQMKFLREVDRSPHRNLVKLKKITPQAQATQ